MEPGLLRFAEELLRSRAELLRSGPDLCRSRAELRRSRGVRSELRRSGRELLWPEELLPQAEVLQAQVPQSEVLQAALLLPEPLPQELLRSRAELLCTGPDLRRPDGCPLVRRSGRFLLPRISNV